MTTAVVFDFETTGLVKHPDSKDDIQPRIIEIGAVLLSEEGEVIDTLSQLVNPEMEIEEVITNITGITQDMLVDKPPFNSAEVLVPLKRFFSADIAIAHNLPFDRDCLLLELRRHGITDITMPDMQVCTVQEYLPLYGRRLKLLELHEIVLGEPLAQTHRALDDALALARIVAHEGLISAFAGTL